VFAVNSLNNTTIDSCSECSQHCLFITSTCVCWC